MTDRLESAQDQLSNDPVFVVGERGPAVRFVEMLGATPELALVPRTRLLDSLIAALERSIPTLADLGYPDEYWRERVNAAYREVQDAAALHQRKRRTVEYSAVPIRHLNAYYPMSQFVVVHDRSAQRRSSRIPMLPAERLIEIGAGLVNRPATTAGVLLWLSRCSPPLDVTDGALGERAEPAETEEPMPASISPGRTGIFPAGTFE